MVKEYAIESLEYYKTSFKGDYSIRFVKSFVSDKMVLKRIIESSIFEKDSKTYKIISNMFKSFDSQYKRITIKQTYAVAMALLERYDADSFVEFLFSETEWLK